MPVKQPVSQGLLPHMGEPSTLPSPKMKSQADQGLSTWSHAYAGFSFEFAESALDWLGVSKAHLVIDPFVGSGTSAVAARQRGCKFIGIDLDPFSALLTRAKSVAPVSNENIHAFMSAEPTSPSYVFSSLAYESFNQVDLKFAAGLFYKIQCNTGLKGTALLDFLLSNPKGKASIEIICLVALMISAKKCSNITRGSNPVWFKQESHAPLIETTSLEMQTNKVAADMASDLRDQNAGNARAVKVFCGDYSEAGIRTRSVDCMITSPPYLSRLDYVVSHLPELTLLSGLFEIDLESLRRRMMGTTKMVSNPGTNPLWGVTCEKILESIRSHASKASATYYYKFYEQYFSELYRFLVWTKKIMKPGGAALFVVQDSYYKELRVPVTEIIGEMANNFSLRMEILRQDSRSGHMGAMDPKQRGYVKRKILQENILCIHY